MCLANKETMVLIYRPYLTEWSLKAVKVLVFDSLKSHDLLPT